MSLVCWDQVNYEFFMEVFLSAVVSILEIMGQGVIVVCEDFILKLIQILCSSLSNSGIVIFDISNCKPTKSIVVIFANILSSHIIDIFSEIYCLQTVITHELLKVSTSGILSLLIPNSFNMAYVELSHWLLSIPLMEATAR